MELKDSDYIRNLGRNLLVGLVLTYAATVGLCYLALDELGLAAAIACVPAIFAGPYVGLLVTLISAVNPRRSAVEASSPTVEPADAVAAAA